MINKNFKEDNYCDFKVLKNVLIVLYVKCSKSKKYILYNLQQFFNEVVNIYLRKVSVT